MEDDGFDITAPRHGVIVTLASVGLMLAYCALLYRFNLPAPEISRPAPVRAKIVLPKPAPPQTVVAPAPIRKPKRVKLAEKRFAPLIRKIAGRYSVEPALVQAIILAESSYDHRAVSSRGAAGLMQLMPATAQAMGVEDRFDPAHNIEGGVRYFKQLMTRFEGDKRMALAAYNAGSRKVRQYRGVPPFKATRRYIDKVMRYYQHYKGQSAGLGNI